MTRRKDEACEPEAEAPGPGQPDLDQLAEAWIALWHSELAGLAADPELVAAWRQAFGLGAAWLRAAGLVPPHEQPAPAAWPPGQPPAAAGAAAVGPAFGDGPSDPLGGGEAARLRARIGELERRLAALELGAAGSGTDRRKARRRRPCA